MRAYITLAFAALSLSAAQADDGLEKRLSPYMQLVAEDPCWLSSRLQMYWSTNATDVFIMGESFDHPGGERAPHPTVKFNGTGYVTGIEPAPGTRLRPGSKVTVTLSQN